VQVGFALGSRLVPDLRIMALGRHAGALDVIGPARPFAGMLVEAGIAEAARQASKSGDSDELLPKAGEVGAGDLNRAIRVKPAAADEAGARAGGGAGREPGQARAPVLLPKVRLPDETTANLAANHIGLIEDIVYAQNWVRGTTVVLLTHNVYEDRRLTERAALLLAAPAETLFFAPNDPRTAASVRGEMV
jgi:hypothetical protein